MLFFRPKIHLKKNIVQAIDNQDIISKKHITKSIYYLFFT